MPILARDAFEFFSRSAEQTQRLGTRLGSLLQPGDLVCLSGDLGSGKTTMVQGIARGWGSVDPVTSPTFVLVNVYRRLDGRQLNHLDAYRLQNASEGEDLDLDELLDGKSLLVEWPEHIQGALPPDCLLVKLTWMADEQRGMVIIAKGEHYNEMLNQFKQSVLGG
jgi:tRNA threonylcarbamoyladenosine biosynthesis protein TsaE